MTAHPEGPDRPGRESPRAPGRGHRRPPRIWTAPAPRTEPYRHRRCPSKQVRLTAKAKRSTSVAPGGRSQDRNGDPATASVIIGRMHGEVQRQPPSRWPAGVDGSFAVVTGVVETPWTGSDTRGVVRHRGAGSSGDAGLDGRDEPAWTATVLLITQRSRVQIPPPLPISAGQAPFLVGEGPFARRAL
jgi:hypothetical protein